MGTSIERGSSTTDLSARGASFDIPGIKADGMDVFNVMEAGREAIEHARSGKGPFIIEMVTYRYRGHSMSDPAKYRSRDEVKEMRQDHDPITTLKDQILDDGDLDEAGLKEIDAEIRKIVNEAAEFAQSDSQPDPSELTTDILIETKHA